jgi:hypothetical protein
MLLDFLSLQMQIINFYFKGLHDMSSMDEQKKLAKSYIDQNIWDGEDRYHADNDSATFSPADLQDLIFEIIDYINDPQS